MTEAESDSIIKEVKNTYNKIGECAENAQVDSFLNYYDDSPYFLMISADGRMNNYEEFKKACTEYYGSLDKQKVVTIQEKFQVLDRNLVIVSWTGNIVASLKNGDTIIMNNYSITSVFKKIDGRWIVIHDHESAQPPEIIKKG